MLCIWCDFNMHFQSNPKMCLVRHDWCHGIPSIHFSLKKSVALTLTSTSTSTTHWRHPVASIQLQLHAKVQSTTMNLLLGHREERRPWLASTKRQMLSFLISRHHICGLGIFVPTSWLFGVWDEQLAFGCQCWLFHTRLYLLEAVYNSISFLQIKWIFLHSQTARISSDIGWVGQQYGFVRKFENCPGMRLNITIEWVIYGI